MNTLPPEYTLIGTDSYGRQVYYRNETTNTTARDVQAELEHAILNAQANYKMTHDESSELEAAIWKERLKIWAKELARESRIVSQTPRIRIRNVNARILNALSAPEGRLSHLKREYPTGERHMTATKSQNTLRTPKGTQQASVASGGVQKSVGC